MEMSPANPLFLQDFGVIDGLLVSARVLSALDLLQKEKKENVVSTKHNLGENSPQC
jgi:hypothetical protein